MGHCSASFLLLSLLLLSGTSYLHTVTFGFCSADPNVGCMDIERKALLKLREGLSDPSDRLSSWGGVDCCNWRGIGCNKTTGRVESLNLRNPYAEGLDSDGDDGTLHALGDYNVGCMSIEMKALLKLKEGLRDHSDQLSPWIGEDCCKWKVVGCNNNLSGEMPRELTSLVELWTLNLSMNYLTGVIPLIE